MRILITGVAGFIGSRLAKYILDNKSECMVVGIDDLSGGFIENVDERVLFFRKDLSIEAIDDIMQMYGPFDTIYHFACYAAEGLSPFLRSFNYQNNVLSTVKMVNAAINYGCGRFVYASSMSVYGYGQNPPPFDENMSLCPIDPYGVSKFSCEMDIKIAGVQHGLDYIIVRPHNFYGPGQNLWDKYRNVLAIWMYNSLNGLPITIFGDGQQRRAFSYINDALEPLWIAGTDKQLNGQIINLGGINAFSIEEAAMLMSKITGNGNITYLQQRHEVKDAWSTYQKSIDLLGFQHRTDLSEGLQKMWAWAQQQPIRPRKEWEGFEITKGLYEFWLSPKLEGA